jgi:heavy metal translocating P-type ATPase
MSTVALASTAAIPLCTHCGLGPAAVGGYCCYGCELAAAVSKEAGEKATKTGARLVFSLLLSMMVMMLSLFLFAEDVYGEGDGGLGWMRSLYRGISAVLSTPVIGLLGAPLLGRGLASLRERKLSMDLLVAVGAAAAYALSIANLLRGHGGVYFDSATSALVLATLGRYLEARARAKASGVVLPNLKIGSEAVEVLRDGVTLRLHPAAIEPGDELTIDVGAALPVDARLLVDAELDLGVLTGESRPVPRIAGDEAPAGAVSIAHALRVVALRPAKASTLERLSRMALGLHAQATELGRVADKFAAALVPVTFTLAIGTWIVAAHSGTQEDGLIRALAVVLAACPCTYGVATPLVLWLALRRGLEEGACVRDASALEALANVKRVAFDKTGTLTSAAIVVNEHTLNSDEDEASVASLVLALEARVPHPIARALVTWAEARTAAPAVVSDVRLIAGRGVVGVDARGRKLSLGSVAATHEAGAMIPEARAALVRDGVELARFAFAETVRPEAKLAVDALRADHIDALILTGDADAPAAALAATLGLEARARMTPEGKHAAVSALGAGTAMVGDGLNDAPALAGVPSFAMESGVALAKGVADVSLLRSDLTLVPWTLALARRAVHIGRINLWGASIYNVVFLGLAAAGMLRPVWAGVSMITSSLLTLASSLRMSAFEGPASSRQAKTEGTERA